MTLKDLAVKHDYYASDSNYYSENATTTYDSWEEFYSINKASSSPEEALFVY